MQEQAAEWLTYAAEDLSVAEELLDSHPTIGAYHAHQAAEGLKALQIHRDGDFERTHDLVRLYHVLDVPDEFRSVLENLNPADTAARYPDAPDIELDQLESAVSQIGELLTWIRTQSNE